MKCIEIELETHAYPVYLGRDVLDRADLWRRHLSPGKTLIVSNDVVAPLYLERLQSALGDVRAEVHIIPDGEQHKTAETWQGILDRLVDMQARRDANLVALGGGVVGDITGFAAASYMRGIRFIQAPTTLLSQVDASVGGKTGINHPRGKNLVGAFHQPAAVFIDSATLDSLPAREFNAGLAEVVKYGAIGDPAFFLWLEEHAGDITRRDPQAIDYLIERSVQNKADIVAQDEKEAGVRALLNFGHTFGHAMEAETAYQGFLHGEAVAIGMVTAARLSEQRGLCPPGSAQRLARLQERFDLPVAIPRQLETRRLADAMQLDKKAIASGLRLVLIRGIGHAVIDTGSSAEEIITAMNDNLESAA
jgi:3-dehydroquinate synthase